MFLNLRLSLIITAKKDLDNDIFVEKISLREWIWLRKQSQRNSYWSIFLLCVLNTQLVQRLCMSGEETAPAVFLLPFIEKPRDSLIFLLPADGC